MYNRFSPSSIVPVATGLALPEEWESTEENLQGYDVTMKLVTTRPEPGGDVGSVACAELRVTQRADGPPVTLAGIRSIPVAKFTRIAVASVISDVERVSPETVKITPLTIPEGIGKNGPTDETLQFVAKVYRIAQITGDPPTQAVKVEFEVSQATAGRWVAAAREKGYLPPHE